jgi:hypothetical protein
MDSYPEALPSERVEWYQQTSHGRKLNNELINRDSILEEYVLSRWVIIRQQLPRRGSISDGRLMSTHFTSRKFTLLFLLSLWHNVLMLTNQPTN